MLLHRPSADFATRCAKNYRRKNPARQDIELPLNTGRNTLPPVPTLRLDCPAYRETWLSLWRAPPVTDVVVHTILHPSKSIPAQLGAAIPARDDHDFTGQARAFQHPKDHHAGPAFTVIVFQRGPVGQQNGPCVMRGFGELLGTAQRFDKGLGVRFAGARATRYRVFRSTIAQNCVEYFHWATMIRIAARRQRLDPHSALF